MANQPECYGRLFPDLTTMQLNRPCGGKAFTVLARSQGIGVQSADLDVGRKAWAACQECPSYRSCYDLSMATLTLRQAMARL
ncbi:MAG: hypothetical protein ACM359_16455 [Bacillota bacterium]